MKENKQTSFTDEISNNQNKGLTIKVGTVLILVVIVIALLLLFTRKVPQYNITFDSNGGSIVESIIVNENGTITKPQNPTKENYEFLGWYYNEKLYDFSNPVTGDMILEAKWGKVGNVSGVKLDQTELNLYIGDTAKLTATLEPENVTNNKVTWKSSDPEVVSVDSNGNITALKEGTAIITVTTKDGGFTAQAQITVESEVVEVPADGVVVNVTGVTLNKTSLTLTAGQTSKLTATVNPTNATNKNVTWKSSNSNVVTVDSRGNIKAIAAGTATITVTTRDGKFTAKATITVNAANNNNNTQPTQPNQPEQPSQPTTVNVTGVSLNKTSLTLTEGNSERLTATVNPSNATNKNVTWSSSNSSVVSVDSNGKVTALKPGTATITVTTRDGNYKATCQVTVNEKPASYSVTLTPIVQPLVPVSQYSVSVKKNGATFSDWKGIEFNNGVKFVNGGGTISSIQYEQNGGITSATITLPDGTPVTATVYK